MHVGEAIMCSHLEGWEYKGHCPKYVIVCLGGGGGVVGLPKAFTVWDS